MLGSVHCWVGCNELPPVVPVFCVPCCCHIAKSYLMFPIHIVLGLPLLAIPSNNTVYFAHIRVQQCGVRTYKINHQKYNHGWSVLCLIISPIFFSLMAASWHHAFLSRTRLSISLFLIFIMEGKSDITRMPLGTVKC